MLRDFNPAPRTIPLLAPSFQDTFRGSSFEKIKVTDYLPMVLAMQQDLSGCGCNLQQHGRADFREHPSWHSDQSGDLFRKVGSIFGAQSSANTNEEMQEVGRKPHHSAPSIMTTSTTRRTFARIKAVYDKRASLNLNKEQAKLFEDLQSFVRSGANLPTRQTGSSARTQQPDFYASASPSRRICWRDERFQTSHRQ